jgi:HlyD family secretion protein
MSKKILLIFFVASLLIGVIYFFFLRNEKPTFELAEVSRGVVSQEISETGQVQKGEEISLSLKSTGRLEKIYVVVGEKVKEGDVLAKIDDSELRIQLGEAQANLGISQANLAKLLAGASQEEIQIAHTEVSNAQIALWVAEQNLTDAYQDSLNILDDSYLKIYNGFIVADSIQRTYFSSSDQESIRVKENRTRIDSALGRVKTYLDTAKNSQKDEDINLALSEMKGALNVVSDALKTIRETCETEAYRNRVTATDKSSLDTQRTNINTALTNITNSQQTISTMKLNIETAQGQLKEAQDNLALTTAKPRQEDIDSYQAQVQQAEAQVNLLTNKIGETVLRSPASGQVIKINKRIGEIVQPSLSESIMTILPDTPFEIKTDIYEEDVAKIKIGNLVDISLIAFPDKVFQGKVIFIDPSQKLTEGVVYYEVRISFQDMPEGTKPGMTADITIQTASRENVLVIPEDSVQRKEGKIIVQILRDNKIEEREIEIGLEGNNTVEVVYGLSEGEKVVIP